MEQFSDTRTFRGHRMNLDASLEAMQPNETREVYHMHEELSSGKIVNMKGFENVMTMPVNLQLGFSIPLGNFKCVGSDKDIENNTIIYALCDLGNQFDQLPTFNHSFLQMNIETKALTWILKAEPLLAFRPDWRVQIDVIEGLMYFNFGYFGSFLNNDFNPPRKINIAKAIKYTAAKQNRWDFTAVAEASTLTGNVAYLNKTAYIGPPGSVTFYNGDKLVAWCMDGINRYKNSTGYGVVMFTYTDSGSYIVITDRPWQETTIMEKQQVGYILPYAPGQYFGIDWQLMDVIKWKPQSAPGVSFGDDQSKTANLVRGRQFQFAFAHDYDDKERTVAGPVSPILLPTNLEEFDGSYNETVIKENYISTWVDSGPMEVRRVLIYAKEGNQGNWKQVKEIWKYDEDGNCLFTSDIFLNYLFYNNESSYPLDQADIDRPYDVVPITAAGQEIIEKNRLLYAKYREGFDNVKLDVALTPSAEVVSLGTATVQVLDQHSGSYGVYICQAHPVGLPTGNFQWFHCAKIDFSSFWQAGFDYEIVIQCNLRKYIPTHSQPFYPQTYANAYLDKYINSSISIVSPPGSTIAQFLDQAASALRANFNNSLVIAFNNHGYRSMDGYDNFLTWNFFNFCNTNELGFVIQDGLLVQTGNPPLISSCDYCPDVTVYIKKFQGRKILPTFKSGEYKNFGVMYCQNPGRQGAVNTSEACRTYIKSQLEWGYVHQLYRNRIEWSINNIPPDWADYYFWVIAKNASFALYAEISSMHLVPGSTNISININDAIVRQRVNSKLFNVAAYRWQPGDRIRFVLNKISDDVFTTVPGQLDMEIIGELLPGEDTQINTQYLKDGISNYILDAYGNKVPDIGYAGIIVSNFNYALYNILPLKTIIEIYRPLKDNEDPVFVEYGEPNLILDPHTENRRHGGSTVNQVLSNGISVTPASGEFVYGDAYITNRSTIDVFPVERRNFSDFYSSDAMSIGLTFDIANRNMRFQEFISSIRYGGRLIQDTQINDLSKFLGADSFTLADKFGSINHIQEVADVLKILQKSKPSSMYIGRAGLTQPKEGGTQIMSSTKDVLGTLIVHPSDKGTVHGGSFVKNENRDYFFDFYAHAICRDAGNGIENLSEVYGINRFMQDKCKAFGTAENVDVISAYDQANELVLWTFTDKTNPVNSFSIAFRDSGGRNEDGFVFFGQFIPDCYGYSKQILTSFLDNGLWLHNSDSVPRCNFYGVQHKYWVTVVVNKLGLKFKRLISIFVSTNKKFSAPNAGDIAIEPNENHPNGMVSLLKSGAFTAVQGKIVADFGKNMITNQTTPSLIDLVNGEDLEGQAATIRLEGEETVEHKTLSVEVQGIMTGK